MLEQLRALSTDSKYTAWYCSIITNAVGRKRFKGCERHHIVPKSIWKEGAKRKDNIVMLTPREHFICHRILAKIMIDARHRGCMQSAFWLMLNSGQCVYTSTTYTLAKQHKSNAMKVMWANQEYKTSMIDKKQWFYNDPAQKETNRQKALQEMKNPETRKKFVQAGLQACKAIRDADPKAWVANSMRSEEGKAKAKQSCQTEEFRECCKARELSKSVEDRQKLAKQGQQALVEKCGGEEAYKKMLSDRIKGRKKYVNAEGVVRVLREPLEGFVPLAQKRIANDL